MKPILLTILALPLALLLNLQTQIQHITTVSMQEASFSSVQQLKLNLPAENTLDTIFLNGCNTYIGTFNKYNWNVQTMLAICMAESHGNVKAESNTDDYGLLQIHQGLELYGTKIFDPYFNISIAHIKYVNQGYHAWTTYNSGAYRNYL